MERKEQIMKTTQSAGIVLFRDEREVLMVQQYGETWSFPKGHREDGESLLQCAYRELREETGIDAGIDWVAVSPVFSYSRESIRGEKEMKEIWLYPANLVEQHPDSTLHSDDDAITAIEWVDVFDVCDRLDAKEDRETFTEILAFYGCNQGQEWARERVTKES